MTRSGAAASSLPKCKYFEQMRFLHENTANRPTESNMFQVETALQSADVLDGQLAPQISVRPVVLNGKKERQVTHHPLVVVKGIRIVKKDLIMQF